MSAMAEFEMEGESNVRGIQSRNRIKAYIHLCGLACLILSVLVLCLSAIFGKKEATEVKTQIMSNRGWGYEGENGIVSISQCLEKDKLKQHFGLDALFFLADLSQWKLTIEECEIVRTIMISSKERKREEEGIVMEKTTKAQKVNDGEIEAKITSTRRPGIEHSVHHSESSPVEYEIY